MNRRLIEIIWFVAIVVLSCVATSAQNSGTPKPQIEYKRGQIWEYLGGKRR